MNNKMKLFAFAALVACLLFAVPEQAQATVYGCTPGYWKNHTDAWHQFAPGQTVASVFDIPANLGGPGGAIGSATLLQALAFPGGPGLDGGARILLRAAVASLLNAAHPDLGWDEFNTPPSSYVPNVIATTNTSLASGSRANMIMIGGGWDDANNNNIACPLN